MKDFLFTVIDANGMHARPAGKLVSFLRNYQCRVTVQANGKEADGRRLLSLLSLGAVHGTQLRFLLEGTDEEECLSALQTFCQEEWKGGASHE